MSMEIKKLEKYIELIDIIGDYEIMYSFNTDADNNILKGIRIDVKSIGSGLSSKLYSLDGISIKGNIDLSNSEGVETLLNLVLQTVSELFNNTTQYVEN